MTVNPHLLETLTKGRVIFVWFFQSVILNLVLHFIFFILAYFCVFHLSEATSSLEKLMLQSTLCSFRDHWNAWCIKSLRSNIRMKVLAPIRLIEQQHSSKIINLWYITCHQNEWKINCNTVELFYKRHWCKRRLIMRDTDVPKIEIGFDQKTKMWYPAS